MHNTYLFTMAASVVVSTAVTAAAIDDAVVKTSAPVCAQCLQSSSALRKCSRCKSVWYCHVDHQRAHWTAHKLTCTVPVSITEGVKNIKKILSDSKEIITSPAVVTTTKSHFETLYGLQRARMLSFADAATTTKNARSMTEIMLEMSRTWQSMGEPGFAYDCVLTALPEIFHYLCTLHQSENGPFPITELLKYSAELRPICGIPQVYIDAWIEAAKNVHRWDDIKQVAYNMIVPMEKNTTTASTSTPYWYKIMNDVFDLETKSKEKKIVEDDKTETKVPPPKIMNIRPSDPNYEFLQQKALMYKANPTAYVPANCVPFYKTNLYSPPASQPPSLSRPVVPDGDSSYLMNVINGQKLLTVRESGTHGLGLYYKSTNKRSIPAGTFFALERPWIHCHVDPLRCEGCGQLLHALTKMTTTCTLYHATHRPCSTRYCSLTCRDEDQATHMALCNNTAYQQYRADCRRQGKTRSSRFGIWMVRHISWILGTGQTSWLLSPTISTNTTATSTIAPASTLLIDRMFEALLLEKQRSKAGGARANSGQVPYRFLLSIRYHLTSILGKEPGCNAGMFDGHYIVSMISILGRFAYDLKPEMGIGVYLSMSLINHSCVPNTSWTTDMDGPFHNSIALTSLREIAPGEEITISYIPLDAKTSTREERAHHLFQYGFDCDCPACRPSS